MPLSIAKFTMLIAVDIGNSSITAGYFTGRGLSVQRIPVSPVLNPDEYVRIFHAFIKETNIEMSHCHGIISSVVSGHTEVIRKALEGLCGAEGPDIMVVDYRMSGIGFMVGNPGEVGTDRIANAVAAFSLCRKPAAVIDFGTATTVTMVDGSGNYIGGSIMPGLRLMNESLGSKTSRLREVELHQPSSALGRDTEGCMLSGLVMGAAGAVERIIEEVESETGLQFFTILTGGNSMLMERFIRRSHILRTDLTLEGLKLLYEKNRPE